MTKSPKFELLKTSTLAESTWLNEVVKRANFYLNHESFLDTLSLLLERVFTETGALPIDSITPAKLKEIAKEINVIKAFVEVGGTSNSTDLTQVVPTSNLISLQGGWVVQADRSFFHKDKEEYHMQVAFGVIKLLHEYARLLTPTILTHEWELRRQKDPTAMLLLDTPQKLGFKYSLKGSANEGDMGSLLEELLSGDIGGRFYGRFHPDIVYKLTSIFLIKYYPDAAPNRRFRPVTISADVVLKIAGSENNCSMQDFIATEVPTTVPVKAGKFKRKLEETLENTLITASSEAHFDDEEEDVTHLPYQWVAHEFSEEFGIVEEGTPKDRKA